MCGHQALRCSFLILGTRQVRSPLGKRDLNTSKNSAKPLMNQWALCRDSATSLLVLGRMTVWIKDMDPELTDAQFQLQVLVRLKLHRGRRSDSLAWVTCHASCGSDPRRAHGHLSHGTLAFDMAHGHVGTRFDYVSTSTWVVARFSLENTVKRQTSSFNTLQILPRTRSRFSSVEHLQTSRACRSTKSTAVLPTVCGEIFSVWISQGIKTHHG